MHMRCIGAFICSLALACQPAEPPRAPYGFDAFETQNFRLELNAKTEINGRKVDVQQVADYRLLARPQRGETELELQLQRYFETVEGAPTGTSQLAISERGLVTRTDQGETRLDPNDANPSGGTIRGLLKKTQASALIAEDGSTTAEIIQSLDPILAGLHVLDWAMLAYPVTHPETETAWNGHRDLPPMGRYQLGIRLPLHYQNTTIGEDERTWIRWHSRVERDDLRIQQGLSGRLLLEVRGESELLADGRLSGSQAEIEMHLDAEQGDRITSRYKLQVRCLGCRR